MPFYPKSFLPLVRQRRVIPPGTRTAYSKGYISSLVGHSVVKVHGPDCRQSARTRRGRCARAAWRRVEMCLNLSRISLAPAGAFHPSRDRFLGKLCLPPPQKRSSHIQKHPVGGLVCQASTRHLVKKLPVPTAPADMDNSTQIGKEFCIKLSFPVEMCLKLRRIS